MKKTKIALILCLTWVLGMLAVFSFPPSSGDELNSSSNHSVLNELSTPELVLRISGEGLDVPGFKADLKFVGFATAEQNITFLAGIKPRLSPEFLKNSRPLFEVLTTFFYFFYTW